MKKTIFLFLSLLCINSATSANLDSTKVIKSPGDFAISYDINPNYGTGSVLLYSKKYKIGLQSIYSQPNQALEAAQGDLKQFKMYTENFYKIDSFPKFIKIEYLIDGGKYEVSVDRSTLEVHKKIVINQPLPFMKGLSDSNTYQGELLSDDVFKRLISQVLEFQDAINAANPPPPTRAPNKF